MRIAEAASHTWLLATLAGWALCIWLLALFGMAGSIHRLDEDPALLRPLPGSFDAAPERLGALQQYAEPAARPLFTDDRRPQPFVIDPMADAGAGDAGFDFVLTSVLRTPMLEMVILQPSGGGRSLGVKVGESPEGAQGWSLVSVAGRSAVFNSPDGEVTLQLRQFDGVGGEAPTPMAVAGPRQGPDAGALVVGTQAPPAVPPATGPVTGDDMGTSPAQTGAPPGDGMPATASQPDVSQDQVEAIRKRIEERRARLRQQAQQNNQTP